MVWFARWRPKFKRILICVSIISTLAAAGHHVQKLKSQNKAKSAYSEILNFDKVMRATKKSMEEVYNLEKEAVEIKSRAERLKKMGNLKGSKKEYEDLLKKYEQIVEILTMRDKAGSHIALSKNQIIRIKQRLKDNKHFDENRMDITILEEDIYSVWVEVDRLTKSASKDYQDVEKILGIVK